MSAWSEGASRRPLLLPLSTAPCWLAVTLGPETSSVLTDGRTERRTICAARWERAV
jgi:hypothetical protein